MKAKTGPKSALLIEVFLPGAARKNHGTWGVRHRQPYRQVLLHVQRAYTGRDMSTFREKLVYPPRRVREVPELG